MAIKKTIQNDAQLQPNAVYKYAFLKGIAECVSWFELLRGLLSLAHFDMQSHLSTFTLDCCTVCIYAHFSPTIQPRTTQLHHSPPRSP